MEQIISLLPLVPYEIMNSILYNCTKECWLNFGSRKLGIHCCIICVFYCGHSCTNVTYDDTTAASSGVYKGAYRYVISRHKCRWWEWYWELVRKKENEEEEGAVCGEKILKDHYNCLNLGHDNKEHHEKNISLVFFFKGGAEMKAF